MRRPVSRPVVFTCDAAYAPAMCVCLTSLYLNSPSLDFATYVFCHADDPAAGDARLQAALEVLRQRFDRRITLASFRQRPFAQAGLGALDYVSIATYDRLVLPDLLDAPSFLYLDADMVVLDDIAPLLLAPLETAIAMAAVDGPPDFAEAQARRLDLPAGDPYVNSGVILVDAVRWRQERILDRALAWQAANRQRIHFPCNDVVNGALSGRKALLHPRWNVMQHGVDFDRFDIDGFRGIFHFASHAKPWRSDAFPRAVELYRRFARVSPLRMPEAVQRSTSAVSAAS